MIMETDTILLKEKLDFHQYQLAIKALSDIRYRGRTTI